MYFFSEIINEFLNLSNKLLFLCIKYVRKSIMNTVLRILPNSELRNYLILVTLMVTIKSNYDYQATAVT